jgi:hypothetical protein
MLTTSAGTTRL